MKRTIISGAILMFCFAMWRYTGIPHIRVAKDENMSCIEFIFTDNPALLVCRERRVTT